jgi:hypothetical protein
MHFFWIFLRHISDVRYGPWTHVLFQYHSVKQSQALRGRNQARDSRVDDAPLRTGASVNNESTEAFFFDWPSRQCLKELIESSRIRRWNYENFRNI